MKEHLRSLLRLENLLGVAVGLLIILGSALASWHARPAQQSVVEFEPPAFDFGRLPQQETARHDFRLVNRSTNEVRILGLRSSCKCTAIAGMAERRIGPKGSLVVPVEFHTGSDQGQGAANVEALLDIGGKRYYAQAIVRSYIEAEVGVEPRSLDFGVVKAGTQPARRVRIVLAGGVKAKPPASTGTLEVALVTNGVASSRNELDLRVIFRAPRVASSMVFVDSLQVETSSKRAPVVKIPVAATVRPEAEIAPDVVVITADESLAESRFTIRTLDPSRVARVTIERGTSAGELIPAAEIADSEDAWNVRHVRRIANSLLAGSSAVNFELQVRHGPEKTEARSVSVRVKSL